MSLLDWNYRARKRLIANSKESNFARAFSFVRFGAQKNKRNRDALWSLSDKRRARVHLRVAGAAQGLGPRTESCSSLAWQRHDRSMHSPNIYMIKKLNKWKIGHFEKNFVTPNYRKCYSLQETWKILYIIV